MLLNLMRLKSGILVQKPTAKGWKKQKNLRNAGGFFKVVAKNRSEPGRRLLPLSALPVLTVRTTGPVGAQRMSVPVSKSVTELTCIVTSIVLSLSVSK